MLKLESERVHVGELLEKINCPKDLKKLNRNQLKRLVNEIREFLLENISKTGGHLASNLGVIEMTIALHYIFQSPMDKIIWDVGHQCYVHKILTGRKQYFETLRKTNGISGFPKLKESLHDVFETGHASTSISAALGMARGRDISQEDYHVIAVIGDGSLTGGMAYEALNDAGHSKTKVIVILNDNQMSIAPNVGGLSKQLNSIRTGPKYIEIKKDVNQILRKIPKIGESVRKTVEKAKDSIKQFVVPGMFFEELGFTYVGPIDGHDIDSLISVFERVKNIEGPILLHVYTTKGRGYKIAEKDPCKYHGISSFDVETGRTVSKKIEDFSSIFGQKLVSLAENNNKIVAVTAAMSTGTGLVPFMKKYPNRFFDVGIAEQHAVTMSAGLARVGYKPIFSVYSTFLQRAYDQVLHDVCIQNLPVIFAIDRSGIVGADGETHQGVYDISYLSHIPNMTIMSPRDANELEEMLEFAEGLNQPVAIRYPRGNAFNLEGCGREKIDYGKAEVLEEGTDVAIFAVGTMCELAQRVTKKLKNIGISCTLINPRFIKPIDEELVIKAANTYKFIVTIEDHVKIGGFGSLLIDIIYRKAVNAKKILSFGWKDEFIPHGSIEDLYKQQGITEENICSEIQKTMETMKK